MYRSGFAINRLPYRAGGAATTTAVDLLLTFESGTNGAALTVGDLNAASLKTSAGAGTWTIPVLAPTITTAEEITISGLNVAGSGNVDTGTRSIRMNTAQDQLLVTHTFTTAAAAVSLGFAMKLTNGGTFNFYNYGEITTTSGEYNALHARDNGPIQIGCEDPLSNIGTLITVTSATWYWVTMLLDNTNNTLKLRLYNPSTWAQVGSESSLTYAYVNDINRISIGRTDNHDVFGTADNWIDDVAVCLSTGVGARWPLLPGGR